MQRQRPTSNCSSGSGRERWLLLTRRPPPQAPDPSPALSAALESEAHTAQLEAQARKLASELAEYKAESKAIKNQDLTIRKQVRLGVFVGGREGVCVDVRM